MALTQAFIILLLGIIAGLIALFYAFFGEFRFGEPLERIGWTLWADRVITPHYKVYRHPQTGNWYKTIRKSLFRGYEDIRCSPPSSINPAIKSINPDITEVDMFWTSMGEKIKSEISDYTAVLEDNNFLEQELEAAKELAVRAMTEKKQYTGNLRADFRKYADDIKYLKDATRADTYIPKKKREQQSEEEGEEDSNEQ